VVKQKLSDRSYAVEVGEKILQEKSAIHDTIPIKVSKTAVFDNLGDGKEPIESTITQRQDDDVRASEMQANLDTSSTKG
jgi:hypothetical protein